MQSPSLSNNAVGHFFLSGADGTNDVGKVFVFVLVFAVDPADGEEGGGVRVPPSSTSASLSVLLLLLVERTLLPLPPPPPLLSLIFDTATSVLLLALQQQCIKIPLKLTNLTLNIGKLGL